MDMKISIGLGDEDTGHAKIKVIGVGGGGGNAINRMLEEERIPGVEFIAVNTDKQALDKNIAEIKIQIGKNITRGLGAGSKPEIGKKAAEESLEEIKGVIEGSDLVFITAGMGGGTGTGASPVIAKLAKEMGILTISVVTTPFKWEGPVRQKNAQLGINELNQYSDAVITISNQKLMSIIDKKLPVREAFKIADKILKDATLGISKLIQDVGEVNADFADVQTIMENAGKAHIGIGYGEGSDKALQAVESAIHSDLLDNVSIKGAKGVLVNIIAGPDFYIDDLNIILERIYNEVDAESDAHIIHGFSIDESFENKVQVLLIATKIEGDSQKNTDEKESFNFPTKQQRETPPQQNFNMRSNQETIAPTFINREETLSQQIKQEKNIFKNQPQSQPQQPQQIQSEKEESDNDFLYPPYLKENLNRYNENRISVNRNIYNNSMTQDDIEYPPFLREQMD